MVFPFISQSSIPPLLRRAGTRGRGPKTGRCILMNHFIQRNVLFSSFIVASLSFPLRISSCQSAFIHSFTHFLCFRHCFRHGGGGDAKGNKTDRSSCAHGAHILFGWKTRNKIINIHVVCLLVRCAVENMKGGMRSLKWVESVDILNRVVGRVPQRSHLKKALKKMREGAVRTSEGRLAGTGVPCHGQGTVQRPVFLEHNK